MLSVRSFVRYQKLLVFAAGLLGGVLASIASYFLFDHVKVRVLAYLDPWSYIDKEDYQITQSLFAISNGGFSEPGFFREIPPRFPLWMQISSFLPYVRSWEFS